MTKCFRFDYDVINELSNDLSKSYSELETLKEDLKKGQILHDLGLDNGVIAKTEKKVDVVNKKIMSIDRQLRNRSSEVRNLDSLIASKLLTFRESMEKE